MNLDFCTVLLLKISRWIMPEFDTWKVPARNFNSLSYRISGETIFSVGNENIKADAGAITFVPAGLEHLHSMKAPTETFCVQFITKENLGNNILVVKDSPIYNFKKLFSSLYNLWDVKPVKNSIQCMAAFYNILDMLNTYQHESSSNLKPDNLRNSLNYMYKHFRDCDFHVRELHNIANVSEAYYRRLFRQTYGCSPVDFLKQLRLNHARELLKTSHYPISEVAELSGFTSQSYFCYSFKHNIGLSPSEYAASPMKNLFE